MRRSRKLLRSSLTKPLLPDTSILVYETVEDSPRHGEAVGIVDSSREILSPSIAVREHIRVTVSKHGVTPSFCREKSLESA